MTMAESYRDLCLCLSLTVFRMRQLCPKAQTDLPPGLGYWCVARQGFSSLLNSIFQMSNASYPSYPCVTPSSSWALASGLEAFNTATETIACPEPHLCLPRQHLRVFRQERKAGKKGWEWNLGSHSEGPFSGEKGNVSAPQGHCNPSAG